MGWDDRWVRFTKHDDDDDEANAWPISRFLAQKLHTIKMVKLVKRLCHELSAKELVATAKKWGFTSQNVRVVLKLGRV